MSGGMRWEKANGRDRLRRPDSTKEARTLGVELFSGGIDRDPDAPATVKQIKLMRRLQAETGVTRPGGATRREASEWIRARIAAQRVNGEDSEALRRKQEGPRG